MTSISKNVYMDKLTDIVNEYNNTYHSTIKLNPVDVKLSTYIDFGIENNYKEIVNLNLVILKEYRNIFAKGYTPHWYERLFMIKKLKILCRRRI